MSRLLTLCAACCVLCSVSAGQHWPDDGEFLLDTSLARVPAQDEQQGPAVAFDGENFLVVWRDYRNGQYTDVYGARVSPDGVVLDATGIPISTAVGDQDDVAVAFGGADFLVAWRDFRDGDDTDIYGARVTTSGTVLDTQGFIISKAASSQWSPALAFDGVNFLVVWADGSSGPGDILGARVTPDGVVLDTAAIAISTAVNDQKAPAVVLAGATFLVVWQDTRSGSADIYGARVTLGGIVLDSQGIAISTPERTQIVPAVCFDGGNSLVAWEDRRNGSKDIYGARVTPAGVVLEQDGIAISTAARYQFDPALSFDGANYLVVWEDTRSGDNSDIYGARVTTGGVVFDSGLVVLQESIQQYPMLARGTGSRVLLAYQGWAGTVGEKTYNANRTWGKMNPNPGVEEAGNSEVRREKVATVVRGILHLWLGTRSELPGRNSVMSRAALLDAAGRKVMELQAGPNDVRRLAPGVYFVREARAQVQAQALDVRKVVITR